MHRMSACILAIAGMSFGNAARAQSAGASIDAGALSMRYADSVRANAIAVTPAFWIDRSSASASAAGTISQFIDGGWSAQASASGSLFTPRYSLLLGEIEGASGGSTNKDGSRTGQLLVTARAHLMNDHRGVWIGAGAGSGYDGSSSRRIVQGEAAAWARFGAATAFISATPVAIGDSIRYTDAQLSASLNLPVIELTATGGSRSGDNSRSWGSASAAAWVASRVAIVASAGTYPVDLTQGFPGGRFVSLSLRIGTRRFPPATSSVREIEDLSSVSRGPRRFEAKNLGNGLREIRFRAPDAATVELMADFTGWTAAALVNTGNGWWAGTFPISTGIHELNVRMDGGRWLTPPGLQIRNDEFGGSVGILIVQ